MSTSALPMLSGRDWELLREQMRPAAFRRGSIIIEEGQHRKALMVIRQGAVRIDRSQHGHSITIAQLGAGEIFGEISFVENAPVSASVIAQDDAIVDVIEGEALQSLMASEPGFAVRFYHSLAITLARRLRATSHRLAEAGAVEVALVNRYHAPRIGNISLRQVPLELIGSLDQFQRSMLDVERAIGKGSLSEEEVAGQIATHCNQIVRLLEDYTDRRPLVEIGYSDLLAFRDTDQLEAGVGDYVFRETFATFMLSATMARCFAKPRGMPEDFDTVATIYRDQAEGDGRLGPLIDRWFLDRAICRSRRASRDLMGDLLHQAVRAQPPGAAVRVASLASGVAAELFDLCRSDDGLAVIATSVDVDGEALLAGVRRAERDRLTDRMTFFQANALPSEDSGETMLPQSVIYALGFCEYLTDEQMLGLVDHVFDRLIPGGVAILTNLAADNPDRLLMSHVLDWKTHHRPAGAVRDMFARSRFGGMPVEIIPDPTGVTLFARVTKGGSA